MAEAETRAVLHGVRMAAPRDWAVWAPYDYWNGAIANEFFGGKRAGRPVYLDMEAGTVASMAQHIASSIQLDIADPERAFRHTVRRTLNLSRGQPPLLSSHMDRAHQWKAALHATAELAAGSDAEFIPPFVGLLALCSLAAEKMQAEEGVRQNNYYDRLYAALEVDTDAERARVQSGIRDHSQTLWGMLNGWLSAAGGARGLPTARAFDSRVHVGLPISQALVREAERSSLPEMFEAYGFHPEQQFARPDMKRILGQWLPSSKLANLKAAWQSGGTARDRIAEVVCTELEHWDGRLPDADSATQLRFRALFAAVYYPNAQPSFSLALVLRDRRQLPHGLYVSSGENLGGGKQPSVTTVVEPGDLVRLETVQSSGSDEDIAYAALGRSIALQHEAGSAVISHRPKPIVVMVRDDSQSIFVEVERAELEKATLVLARGDHAATVEQALSEIAKPGYTVAPPSRAIPQGWTLFAGVRLRSILDNAQDVLGPLVPRSRVQVEFSGGMRIPVGRWHSKKPPVAVVAASAGTQFSVQLASDFTSTGESIRESFGPFVAEAQITLDQLGLPDGNYRLQVLDSRDGADSAGTLIESTLKLRSSGTAGVDPIRERPKRQGSSAAIDGWSVGLQYEKNDGGTLLPIDRDEAGGYLQPVPPDDVLPLRSGTTLPADTLDNLFARLPLQETGKLRQAFERLSERGLVTVGPDGPILTPKGKRNAEELRPSPRNRRPNPQSGARRTREQSYSDADLILDAMIVSGWSTWRSFRGLVDGPNVPMWEPSEVARNLRALGHIEIELERASLQPVRWAVGQPTIVVADGGKSAFVAGKRSTDLLGRIEEQAKWLGGSVSRLVDPRRPVLLRIEGLALDQYREVAERTNVICIPEAGRTIAEALPTIREVYRRQPELHIPDGADLERFDFSLNDWVCTDEPLLAGAYRIQTHTIRHAVLADDGLRECDSMVAKFAGAAAGQHHIMSYDPDAQTLSCQLGARPPGLYERAIVLASGDLPRKEPGRGSIYGGVPPVIARWMARKLGPAGWKA